nr:MAG TPA: hypothetical protein [Caudoviricetes sp.]
MTMEERIEAQLAKLEADQEYIAIMTEVDLDE